MIIYFSEILLNLFKLNSIKVLYSTDNPLNMANENQNRKVEKSIRLDDIHWKIIRGLMPFYGSSEGEVIRNIVLMWLHDNIGSQTITKLENLNGVKLVEGKEAND